MPGLLSQSKSYLVKEGIKAAKTIYADRNNGPHLRGAVAASKDLKKPTVAEVKDIVRRTIRRDTENMDSPVRSILAANIASGKLLLSPNDYFPELVQGVGEGQRLGQRINAQRLRFYFHMSNTTAGSTALLYDTYIRVTFARWRFADGSNTLPNTSSVDNYGTPLNKDLWDIKKSFLIKISSVKCTANDSAAFRNTYVIKSVKLGRVLRYSDATTSCPNNFPYYLIITSNNTDAVNCAVLATGSNCILYYENKQ